MISRLFASLIAALTFCWLVLPAPAVAQDEPLPFAIQLTIWNLILDQVDQEAEASGLARRRVDELKQQLSEIRTEAEGLKADFESRFEPFQSQLDALGPPPEEGEPPEPAEVATQRERLRADIAEIDGHIKQVEVIIARANELDRRITRLARRQLVDQLSAAFPFPLAPDTVSVAVPEFLGVVREIAQSPVVWWQSLGPDDRGTFTFRAIIVIPLALAVGLFFRIALRRWFGRHPTISEPTYTRRLIGAVAEAAATGIIPALIFAGFLYRATHDQSLITGPFRDFVVAFCTAMILIILALALPRAVLAPDRPDWRLLPVRPKNARKISNRIGVLAAVVAVDLLLRLFWAQQETSDELLALYVLVVSSLEAALLIALTPGRLWTDDDSGTPEEPSDDDDDDDTSGKPPRPWMYLRRTVAGAAAIAILSAFLGYSYLSAYLTTNLVITSVVIGVLILLRGVLRELVGAAFRSRFLMAKLRIRHRMRTIGKFWFRIVLDVVLGYLALVAVAPAWGVPQGDVWRLTGQFLAGVKIGNVTISVTEIFVAVFAFIAATVLTRMLQRALEDQILPQTRLDAGVRNSIKVGVGYAGIALAALIAFALLGIDLSNLAIIAGALSVGIGFGLQSVVNNFVSGMILLVERPIKAGDWIQIGEHEGFVRRISVRATEIETFTKASVIIPNSELLSGALTNMTHKDQYGRVDVNVGVAYGSDVDQVMKILRETLEAHPRILNFPESSVVFLGFGDSSLDFQARGFISSIIWRIFVQSDLLVEIYRRLDEAGIEIPFPQRDLHLKDIDRLEAMLGNQSQPPATDIRRPATDGAQEKA